MLKLIVSVAIGVFVGGTLLVAGVGALGMVGMQNMGDFLTAQFGENAPTNVHIALRPTIQPIPAKKVIEPQTEEAEDLLYGRIAADRCSSFDSESAEYAKCLDAQYGETPSDQ